MQATYNLTSTDDLRKTRRERFEKLVLAQCDQFQPECGRANCGVKNNIGEYRDPETQAAWIAWQVCCNAEGA